MSCWKIRCNTVVYFEVGRFATDGAISQFLNDRTARSRPMIRYWHDAVVCLSIRSSVCL